MLSELSDIFCKDPLTWTRADLELAIAYLKEHRGHFDLIKKDGSVKRKRKPKAKTDLAQIDWEGLIKEMTP